MMGKLEVFLLIFVFLTAFSCASSNTNIGSVQGREAGSVFNVLAAGDQHYFAKNYKNSFGDDALGRADLVDLLYQVSLFFKRQGIDVEFVAREFGKFETWEKSLVIDEEFPHLKNTFSTGLERNDLILGLSSKDIFKFGKYAGLHSEGYIILLDYSPLDPSPIIKSFSDFFLGGEKFKRINENSWTVLMLAHEIGHFFGLPHNPNNTKSVMSLGWEHKEKKEYYFTPEEKRVINDILKVRRYIFNEFVKK